MSSKLDRIRIATPCPITWEEMLGDERVRFCKHCQLNVYNLSTLNKADAEALLASTEGRLCARLYRRSDGTVLTRDCPVGLRAIRRKMAGTAAAVFALLGSLTSMVTGQSKPTQKDSCTAQTRITKKDIVSSSEAAILTGLVLDPVGAVVPGATISLRNVETKITQRTMSTDEGRFQFVGVVPGKYLIKIESPGFSKHQISEFEVSKDQAINLDVTLSPDHGVVMVGIIGETPSDPPGTTTITEKLFRSLPH